MNQYLNERSNKILKILLEHKEPVTIGMISEELNVSNRTIRYDLEELDEYLKQYEGVSIEKKARVGIWLLCSEEKLDTIRSLVYKNKSYIKPLSTEERKYYIIRQLIQASDIIKMQNLANELYVSRVTIHNDLKYVEEWLSKFDLKLIKKQNYGLQISGEEKNWRRAVSALLTVLKDNEELKYMINDADKLHHESRLSCKSFKKIKELIPDIDLRVIEIILKEAEREFNLSLTDEAFEGMVVHIAISIRRLNSNKAVELNKEQLQAIKEVKEYEIGQWIAGKFKSEFSVNFSESEIAYLTLHILGSKIHENVQLSSHSKIIDSIDEKLKTFTKDVINLISNILGTDLNKDVRLYNGLILHLRPAINRMEHGMNLRNPLIDEIKDKMPAVFGASWATSNLFEKYFNIKVSEEEIGYIAMHVGAAQARVDTNVKAIVVCGSGIGTCELVAARVSRQIPNLSILGSYSLHDVKSLDMNTFDFIISTVPMDNPEAVEKPIVTISPLTAEEDINRIKKAINNVEHLKRNEGQDKEAIKETKQQLFYNDLIFVKEKVKSKFEIIAKLTSVLLDRGFVEKEFTDSLFSRETLTSTAIGKGVALPHGGEKFVKHSNIVIATLEEPIEWGGEMVDIIFLLALRLEDRNYIKSFFSYFYTVLDDENMLNKIRNSSTKEQILELISNFK